MYAAFVKLDNKFLLANIKWDLCQNTIKFQNMTSLVERICTNRQDSLGYYLLNWVLASMYSCSRKLWILLRVSTCREAVHSFQNPIWMVVTLLFIVASFSLVCMAVMILLTAIWHKYVCHCKCWNHVARNFLSARKQLSVKHFTFWL